MNAAGLQEVTDWLIDGARSATSPIRLMAETCERLVAAGMPLWRVAVFVRTLHPDIYGRAFFWRPGAEVVMNPAGFEVQDSPEYRRSPLAILFDTAREVRYRLDDPESRRFPFFDDMRGEGVTDYIALPLLFIDGSTHGSSWTTKQPGGFGDDAAGRAASDRAAAGADRRDRQSAPHRLTRCSTPMSATAPASASSAARSAAATPTPCMPRSGCRICAASPRCRTGCRPRPWWISSITTSIARSPRSATMAARC